MPITEELKNIKNLESVGFTHEQAETLADVIEQSHTQSQESLKDFIRNEINGLHLEINTFHNETKNEINTLHLEIKNEIKDLEVRLMTSQKDLLIKLFGIIVGTVGLAVTILKLF